MKRQIGKNLCCMSLTMILVSTFLSGCGETDKIDYSMEGIGADTLTEAQDLGESMEGMEGRSGLAQFAEAGKWKDTVTSDISLMQMDGRIEQAQLDMTIDAPIMVPEAVQMSVVEVAEQTFDANFKKTVAENLFGEEIYYGDISHLPRQELQRIQDFFDAGGVITYSATSDILEVEPDWQQFWDTVEHIENASETYTTVEEYSGNEYIGTYEGREYDLTFAEVAGDYGVYYSRKKQITLEVRDLYEVCPENFRDKEAFLVCSAWTRGDWAENQCELTDKEAEKKAKDFAEQLGLDYPVFAYTRPLVWGTPPEEGTFVSQKDDDQWGINGYVCYFDVGIDELPFVSYGTEQDYWNFQMNTEESEEIQYSLNAQLQVYVTDKGIIRAIANSPVEITGVSEGVELLPLDTIKGIMKKVLAEQGESLRLQTYVTDYNEMELIYFRVSDKENPGRYSYVPAWRLGAVTRDTVSHRISVRNQILINAIDGSFIDFFEET